MIWNKTEVTEKGDAISIYLINMLISVRYSPVSFREIRL